MKKNNLSFQFEFRPDNNVKFHFSSAIIPGGIQTKYKFSEISNVGEQTFSANYSQSQNTIGMELQLFDKFIFFIEQIEAQLNEVVSDTLPYLSNYANNDPLEVKSRIYHSVNSHRFTQ